MNQILNPIGNGRFQVTRNELLSHVLEKLVDILRVANEDTFSGGGQKLSMPMDPRVNDDDPLARLERESSISADVAKVSRTLTAESISTDEAYAWMRVATLAKSVLAGSWGISTSDDLENLDEMALDFFSLLNAISWQIVVALDPEISPELHPELYEGIEGA